MKLSSQDRFWWFIYFFQTSSFSIPKETLFFALVLWRNFFLILKCHTIIAGLEILQEEQEYLYSIRGKVKLQTRNSYCSIEHLKKTTSKWIVAIVVKMCLWLSQGYWTQTKIRNIQVRLERESRSYDKTNREPAYK